MMPADRADNTKIVFLYVHSFNWVNSMGSEDNHGHPKNGQVYRAVYNTDTKSYRLIYETEKERVGIYLSQLVVKQVDETTKEPGYTSNIVEITRKNILDLNLSEEALDEILEMMKDKELPKELNSLKKQQVPTIDPVQAIASIQQQAERVKLAELGDMVIELRESNRPLYDVLEDIVVYAIENEANWLDYSKTLGVGRNIGTAIQALNNYGGDDRRTNLAEEDLQVAIHHLLLEAGRRKIHNIE